MKCRSRALCGVLLERVGNVYHGGRELCSRYVKEQHHEKNGLPCRLPAFWLTSCEEKVTALHFNEAEQVFEIGKRVNCVS